MPPEDTPEEVVVDVLLSLSVEPNARPTVDALLVGEWLGALSGTDARQPILAWLMKAAAKRAAQKIIDY